MPTAIFDLNGVFILSPYLSDRFEEDYGVSSDTFLPALKEIMGVVRRPNAPSCYSLWQPYLDQWGVDLDEEKFFEYWFSAEKANKEMVGLAQRLKADGWDLVLVSNNFRERTEYYGTTFDFLNLFTQYFSWETGLVKPDEQVYQRIMAEHEGPYYYFDDSEMNVRVAQSLGIEAHKYQDGTTTRKVLGLK